MGRLVGYNARIALMAAGLSFSGCKGAPEYPKCETDEHCKEKGELCVNGQCQECRDDAHCEEKYPDEPRECVDGRCDPKPECRADSDCASVGGGLVCRSEKCVPECTADADCSEGNKCEDQRCVASAECEDDIACGPGRKCDNGTCVDDAGADYTKVSAQCRPMSGAGGEVIALDVVAFDFDRYDLTINARDVLEQNVECMKQVPDVTVVVEGHCDERGTQEYNLALGEKRANTVKDYLRNLGIDTSRMITRSKGENEPVCSASSEECWSKNRRVQFIQKVPY